MQERELVADLMNRLDVRTAERNEALAATAAAEGRIKVRLCTHPALSAEADRHACLTYQHTVQHEDAKPGATVAKLSVYAGHCVA